MENEEISTNQEYKKSVYDFIIKNDCRKMSMEEFLYGYQLYCQGKESYQDLANIISQFIKKADVEMITTDDAFQVTDIQESLMDQKEQIYNRMVNRYLLDVSLDSSNSKQMVAGYDLYCLGRELHRSEYKQLAESLLKIRLASTEQFQDLEQSYKKIINRYLKKPTILNYQRWKEGYDLYLLGSEWQSEERTALENCLLNIRVMVISPEEKIDIEEGRSMIVENKNQHTSAR